MSNNAEQNIRAKLEELEAELNQKQATNREKVETVYGEIETDNSQEAEFMTKVYSWLSLAKERFNSLSAGGKLVVGIAVIWLGFTALNMVLHLISNLIIVSILGVILYFTYQKLIASAD